MSVLDMRMPTAPRMWLSACLICAGAIVFLVYSHWERTRTWVAVDMPISLAPGHVRTGDFYINLDAVYYIKLELEGYNSWHTSCQDYKIIQTRWWVSHQGRVISTWDDYWRYWNIVHDGPIEGRDLGNFEGAAGHYSLDVEVVSDATCLRAYHPRLLVYADDVDYTHGGFFRAIAFLSSCALVAIGFVLFFLGSAAPAQTQVARGESLAIFHALRAQRAPTRPRLLLMGPASILPTVGYVYALTYFLLFLVYFPFNSANWRHAYGLPARLVQPGVLHANMDHQTTGLLVYVDVNGKMYLNSKPVTAEELPRALESEFARRADWSVYVEGDLNTTYGAVIRAMDLVRGAQGKVIMLTPKMRAEANAGRN